MKKIWQTFYKVIVSRKGQAWIFYNVVITFMAFKLHGTYPEWGGYFIGGLLLFGIGVQHDKTVDPETKTQGAK